VSDSELDAPVHDAVHPAQDERHDADDRLKPEFVQAVMDRVDAGDEEGARALVAPLHPADVADLFELADRDERRRLAALLADELDGEVIAEMNDWVRDELLDALEPGEVAELAGPLDTDDAVAIIEDLEEDEQQAVLEALDPDDRAAIEEALSYPEESAGRIMRRDFVAVPEHWSVGQLIDFLRGHDELTTDFWEIYVVDPQHRPVGTILLSWILRAPRSIAITDLMQREQTLIPVDMDQEEVALRFQKYALITAAVVDTSGRLVGMITVDDIVHIIQEEASEDALLLSGVGEGDINEPVIDSYKARVRWLLANLVTALVASMVISMFEGAIAKLAVLAALMPIVAGVGGNAGTQALAVTVRALATNQLTGSNRWRSVNREFRVAALNGVTVALVIGLGVGLVFSDPLLGGVIATAMLVNIVIAGLAGVLVPLLLERLGADPAVASSVFLTMITDSMGFFVFLSLAVASGLVG
jgi:magnesium transporter